MTEVYKKAVADLGEGEVADILIERMKADREHRWFDELVSAISKVPVVPAHALNLHTDLIRSPSRERSLKLTNRHKRVLQGLAEGKTHGDMSLKYGLSRGSIKKYVHEAIFILDARTQTHAVTEAIRRGYVTVDYVAPEFVTVGRKKHTQKTNDQQIKEMICSGYSNPEIATELQMPLETIKDRVSDLLVEFGARDRTHLAALLVAKEIVEMAA